jgi:hypothetical protein
MLAKAFARARLHWTFLQAEVSKNGDPRCQDQTSGVERHMYRDSENDYNSYQYSPVDNYWVQGGRHLACSRERNLQGDWECSCHMVYVMSLKVDLGDEEEQL